MSETDSVSVVQNNNGLEKNIVLLRKGSNYLSNLYIIGLH